jgi:hypothetical protein
MSSRRRLSAVVALAVGAALTGCTATSGTGQNPPALKSIAVYPNGSIPAYESAAVASISTQQNLREFLPCTVGKKTIVVGETFPDKETADLSVTLATHATGQGASALVPKSGEYEVASIEIRGLTGFYSYSASQFAFITTKGQLIRSTDGNSGSSGFGPALGTGTVTKGKLVTGTLTFDVPKGGGGVVFSYQNPRDDYLGARCDWVIAT